ncbi:MAG: hypothetical protein K8J09_23375 [Planctomycetes bacterium]|nr:hypothetical protein [Planctomycetota bacterium]MCC7399612.1 hypothetical protein [Planctomycetota bacterium]
MNDRKKPDPAREWNDAADEYLIAWNPGRTVDDPDTDGSRLAKATGAICDMLVAEHLDTRAFLHLADLINPNADGWLRKEQGYHYGGKHLQQIVDAINLGRDLLRERARVLSRPRTLTGDEQRVVDHLRKNGATRRADLLQQVAISETTFDDLLARLCHEGVIHKPRRGSYAAGRAPEAR